MAMNNDASNKNFDRDDFGEQKQAIKQEYDRLHPNAYQKKIFKQLCHSKYEQEITQQEYKFLQIQIHYINSSCQSFENVPIAESTLINSIENPQIREKLFDSYKAVAIQARAELFAIFKEYEKQYQNKIVALQLQWKMSSMIDGTSVFDRITECTSYQTNLLKQDIVKKVSSFRSTLIQLRQHSSSTRKDIIDVSPESFLDLLANPFIPRERNHLSLGPSYIRLNQSAIYPRHQQEIVIGKQHEKIYEKVKQHLIKYHFIPLKATVFKTYSNEVLDYFDQSYFSPLPFKDQVQASEEAKTAAAIQRKIKKFNLILRLTDKGHNFYIGSATEFEKKVQTFFQETNAFMELRENPLDEILKKVIQLLNQLYAKKLILSWKHKKMMPDRNKCELSHLYFNPKTHKDGVPVRPIENTIAAPTRNISDFLDKIIRPIFDNKCSTTSIIDGTSLIKNLTQYAKRGLLKPTTLFCTFDIRNLYTMLPQEKALNILMEFLHVHGYTRVKGIPLDAIRKLASLVLKENVFVYGKTIYRQILGGAMGSSFTLTLANIFMWKWQKQLVRIQEITGEFYGR
ncbi:unnamed protein product [Rotaria sordida]|uniref:Reverse transcriptase domain-containing protein n=1 Tax=Rotaria sordida TaxID=392033 RepID=A0A819V2F6_9BILA|nr:unnamed protein product [Rotaria sordida]